MPPTILLESLNGIRRRVKLLGAIYGSGIVVACAVVLLLVTVLLDYLLNLPPVPRLVFLAAAVGGVGYALLRYIVKPLLAKLSLSDVAGRLEQAFPQFDDRLRSTVDFVRSDVPGSEFMKQQVVNQTAALAGQLDLGSAVVARPAWLSLGAGFGAIGLTILIALMAPTYSSIALSRLVSPFAAQPWPKRVQIGMLSTLPTRVPVGQRIDVRMRLERGDSTSRKASIFYQYDGGPVQREFMQRGSDGVYVASPDVRVESGKQAASLKIWIEAGDDDVQLAPITVVPRLAIRGVEAQLTPPPYVRNQQPTTVNLTAAPAVVADGATIALRVNFNKPLAGAAPVELVPAAGEMKSPEITWTASGTSMTGTWTARDSLRFHIKGTDTDGFNNNALEEFEVIVRPDQSPSVQIENPRRNEERTAVATIPLQGLVEDDYGIASLKLVIDRLADKRHWEIDLMHDDLASGDAVATRVEGSTDRIRQRVLYKWDLAQLADAQLKPGDVLEYHLLAQDNFVLDGQRHAPVTSGRLRIQIISQEELASKIVEELRQVKSQIGGVKNSQERTRQETTGLQNDTQDKPQLDAADRAALERLTNQQATSASQTKTIAGRVQALSDRLTENKSESKELAEIARDVNNDLERAAENPMKEATSQLSRASQPNSTPQQRNQAMQDASSQQQQAADDLQRAMDRMANIGTLQQTIERVKELLDAQKEVGRETRQIGKENLGKTPDQMKLEDRDRLSKNADAQAKLAERTAKALEEMNKLAEQMNKSDPASSEAMKRAAQTASQQQVTQNQQKASQQARQNQQAQAQAAQRQVEVGLELMLNQLREAERHKLAELQKRLEELQKQIANLIRRQSAHNLDNLSLQGPEKVKSMDSALIADLLDKAEREADKLPAVPALQQLTASQEQTERNTRDIAKSAEAMPNGAEAASHLTRAAGRMERAIVALRDARLPDAYEPPQVEALAALERAKKVVDDHKANVDQQLEDQDRESIKAKYVKIKEDQQRLNEETTRIDKSRTPAGELNRVEAVRLGQLPGEQGKLSDRVDAITQDLASLGSIVYVWANKDIIESMSDVKDDLGQQSTGEPTQAEQTRIVEQLDAMIRNLITKPKESKFAAEGGGGQCNPGPRLPTEAELRLLQELQRAVNTSTTRINAQPNKDKGKLLALGGRQGELRRLLDETLQKASQGQVKLNPEPDNRDQLPEEARAEDIENNELMQNLLQGVPDEEKNATQAKLIGDRMGRSRQRLALNNDPGAVTQAIQKRIIEDFDYLIDQARQQQAQVRNPPKGSQGQKMAQARPNPAQAQNQGSKPGQPKQGGANPAQASVAPGAAARTEDLSKDIKETAAEWGQITPRLRDAVIDSAGEHIVEEYRKLVEEYYRSVGNKGSGQ